VFAVVQDQQQRNKQRLQEEIARQEAEDRAAALRKQLEGLWHESGEYDSNYSGGDKARYHAKFTGTLRVSPDGGGFRGVWNETYIFRDSNHPRGYTAYYQATFALEISGDQVTSNPKSARRRYNHGDWKSLAGVTFSGAITQAGLKYHIVWEKSANGTEIDWTSGTLKH
jgi:hypothetical protein